MVCHIRAFSVYFHVPGVFFPSGCKRPLLFSLTIQNLHITSFAIVAMNKEGRAVAISDSACLAER